MVMTFCVSRSTGVSLNSAKGGCLKWIEMRVSRTAMRFPVRM